VEQIKGLAKPKPFTPQPRKAEYVDANPVRNERRLLPNEGWNFKTIKDRNQG
jgi:hypothetical protein